MVRIEPTGVCSAEEQNRLLEENAEGEKLIHNGRNKIWRTLLNGEDVAVKKFGMSALRSVIYAFRPSKAKRSYLNAKELIKRGIDTPKPIAFIEKRNRAGLLTDNVYVCAYEETESLEAASKEDNTVMIEFARFVGKLHERGIRHDDLNMTNVRVKGARGERNFSLIDLNRMKVYDSGEDMPLIECFKNITRFSGMTPGFRDFVRGYVKYRRLGGDAERSIHKVKTRHDEGVDRLRRIKRCIMPLKKKYRR